MKRQLVPETLKQHPGVLITVAYALISLIGMLFSHSLFSQFGINYFNYAEVSDFLLASPREPMTFALAGGAVAVTLVMHLFSYLEQRWFAKHPPQWRIAKAYKHASSWAYYNVPMMLAVFVLYSFLFLDLYGEWKSERIKHGDGKLVEIVLADGVNLNNVILLGTSNRFVFVYDAGPQIVSVIPNESIVRLIAAAETP